MRGFEIVEAARAKTKLVRQWGRLFPGRQQFLESNITLQPYDSRSLPQRAHRPLTYKTIMRFADLVLFTAIALIQRLPDVTSQLTDPESVQLGDEVCFEGFVMDNFCIELGNLLDVRLLALVLERSI